MANETIGTCACFICGIDAQVRRNRKGKLYLYCPDCGMIQPNLKGAQAHIEKRMKPLDSLPPLEPNQARSVVDLEPSDKVKLVSVPEPEPEPEPPAEKDDLDAMWD